MLLTLEQNCLERGKQRHAGDNPFHWKQSSVTMIKRQEKIKEKIKLMFQFPFYQTSKQCFSIKLARLTEQPKTVYYPQSPALTAIFQLHDGLTENTAWHSALTAGKNNIQHLTSSISSRNEDFKFRGVFVCVYMCIVVTSDRKQFKPTHVNNDFSFISNYSMV